MMFKTKHLTLEEALAAARAAAVISRHGHIVVQARNGRFKWGRMHVLWSGVVRRLSLHLWYVSISGDHLQLK